MLDSILTTSSTGSLELGGLMLCTLASLVLGIGVAWVATFRNASPSSKSFVVTLALLPVMVQTVIMMVNGNLGTGVAVMGAFGLVRFRSAPGSAREIGGIFFAMAVGLATGMGYLAFAFVFFILAGAMFLLLSSLPFGEPKQMEKELKITIPENMEYTGIFDDLFAQYTSGAKLVQVKTTNMGSLYELCYQITLKSPDIEKKFLDEIRCRNGNLNLVCGRPAGNRDAL